VKKKINFDTFFYNTFYSLLIKTPNNRLHCSRVTMVSFNLSQFDLRNIKNVS
jgi:hypothetical protein